MKNKNVSNTKIILISALALFVLILVFFIYNNSKKINEYKEISYDELVKLVDSEENFILFIGSNSCSHCNIYKETLNIVISKTHVLVNYIDISKLNDEELAYINARFSFTVTPTTVFIKKGNEDVSDRVEKKIVGSLDSSKIKELFKKYGYIKE